MCLLTLDNSLTHPNGIRGAARALCWWPGRGVGRAGEGIAAFSAAVRVCIAGEIVLELQWKCASPTEVLVSSNS